MQAFSNATIKDKLCGDCACQGFAPAIAFSLSGNTVTFTDSSVFPSGDSRSVIHFAATDRNGLQVKVSMAGNDSDNAVTLDISTLDRSEGIKLTATVVSTNDCLSDGNFFGLGVNAVAGNFGFWDKDNDAQTV